eukprot:415942_1
MILNNMLMNMRVSTNHCTAKSGLVIVYSRKKKKMNSKQHYVSLQNDDRGSFNLNPVYRETEQYKQKQERKITIFGVCIMLFGAICYSGLVSIVKWASNLGYASMQILLFKASTQIAIAIPFSLIKCNRKFSIECGLSDLKENIRKIDNKLWIFILLRGLFGALTTVFYFEAIVKLPVGDAIVLYSMYPVPTAFVSFCALNEGLSYKYIFSLVLCVIGTFLIIQPDFIFGSDIGQNEYNIMIGYVSAILSAVLMSGVFIFIRLAKAAPPTILIIAQGISCIIEALIIGLIFQHFNGLNTVNDFICLCSIGIVGYCAQWSLTKASQILPAALSSLLRSTDIIWTYLAQILIFHELPSYLTYIGAFIILFAILFVTMEKIKQKELIKEEHNVNTFARVSIEQSINSVDKTVTH